MSRPIAARASAAIGSMSLTFLGTASAQPSTTRNHSALSLRLDSDVWLFDCGEATQHQIQRSSVRMGRISKIFLTHTHGDHCFGLVPLLASRLNGAGGTAEGVDDPRAQVAESTEPPLEIYGPFGTRAYVRAGLTYSHTLLSSPYIVHELRLPTDPPSAGNELPPHSCEREGRDLAQDGTGVWRDIFRSDVISVSAAPIAHSVPCVGYVVQEASVPGKMEPSKYVPALKRTGAPMSLLSTLQRGESVTLPDRTTLDGPPRRAGRKIAILGDTYDPTPIAGLARGADVLVHEATNAYLPGIDPDTKPEDSKESVEARARSRGHSTPDMAGAFARRIGARQLILNHFSSRYRGDDQVDEEAKEVLDTLRQLAAEKFGSEGQGGKRVMDAIDALAVTMRASKSNVEAKNVMDAIRALAVTSYGSEAVQCARDFMSVDIQLRKE